LRKYNALWYYDYRKIGGRAERAILSLRHKKILIKTEDKCYHYVNPFAIRRGQITVVIAATYIHIEKVKMYSKILIKDLPNPKHVKPDLFDFVDIDEMDISLSEPFLKKVNY